MELQCEFCDKRFEHEPNPAHTVNICDSCAELVLRRALPDFVQSGKNNRADILNSIRSSLSENLLKFAYDGKRYDTVPEASPEYKFLAAREVLRSLIHERPNEDDKPIATGHSNSALGSGVERRPRSPEPAMAIDKAQQGAANSQLVITSAAGSKVTHTLDSKITTIGRDLSNDVVIDDSAVSARHALIRNSETGYHVRDLRSTNGTQVNGIAVVDAALHHGDEIRFGSVSGIFHDAAHGRSRFSWRALRPVTRWSARIALLIIVFALGLWTSEHSEQLTVGINEVLHKRGVTAIRHRSIKPQVDRSVQAPLPSVGTLTPAVSPSMTSSVTASASSNTEGGATAAVLRISNLEATELPDRDAEQKITLQISVEGHPKAVIDRTKVQIQVFFYDLVDGKEMKLTDAKVNYEWLTPNHDWAGAEPKVLAVTYVRPRSKTLTSEPTLTAAAGTVNAENESTPAKANPPPEARQRKYLGYIVLVYYNSSLQDEYVDPAALLKLLPAPLTAPRPSSTGPDGAVATTENSAEYAMKRRTEALLKVEQTVQTPTSSHATNTHYPWKTNIVTTVFWVGKQLHKKSQLPARSAWDPKWVNSYGGFDNPKPSARRNYLPAAFIPRQNPFYCALPYNDVTHGQFKPEARLVIPWFKELYVAPGRSVCWHRWVAIRKGNRTCYAQWEDCGPFRSDDFQYVFGNERPKANLNRGAGLNVSPAVRDYLGVQPTDVTDWQFVDVRGVPLGPWRSYGDNNNFVLARRQMLNEEMKEAPAFDGPAGTLYRQYKGREFAADADYRGKVAAVHGTLVSIGKTLSGETYIVVGDPGAANGVECRFSASDDSTMHLSKGDSVSVRGGISGKLANVMLSDCSTQQGD